MSDEQDPMMASLMANATTYRAVSTKNNMSLRTEHTVYAAKLGQLAAGKTAIGNEVWTAQADGNLVKAGDTWLHVTEMDGAAVSGWMAIIHLGVTYMELVEVFPDQEFIAARLIRNDGTFVEFVPK